MRDEDIKRVAASRNDPIEIDDDETASEFDDDEQRRTTTHPAKRKFQDVWNDEPDEVEQYKKREKENRRLARGGRTHGKSAARGKGKGKVRTQASSRRDTRDELDKAGRAADDEEDERDNSCIPPFVPPHIASRRAKFDDNLKELSQGGLKLPPKYNDLDFSDDERDVLDLKERPEFDSIKPCRPYKDICLETTAGVIPASIAQYLRDYQIEGVKFLHEHFVYQTGAILGDDMGLGKTVQVAAFLTAAFGKTGDERDAKRLRKVRRDPHRWYPRVIIVCPTTLIENWKSELERWGWWKVSVYHDTDKDDALRAASNGAVEIMITTYFTYVQNRDKINVIEWDAVVADEFHQVKGHGSKLTQGMADINALCRIGLTGTAIQNKYEEFWTLLNWTNPGRFGERHEWDASIAKPLTRGQSHDATMNQLSIARKTARRLVENLLPPYFLRRMKSLIAHQLPKKTDKVVFCPLTRVQKDAYQRLLEGEEVQTVLRSFDPCSCGKGGKQGWCCGIRLPDGRTWRALVFPCIMALQKISNHLTILIPPDEAKTADKDKWNNALNLFKQAVPLRWESLYRNRHQVEILANPEFCGKWKILRELLSLWYSNKDKVLVFSHSVRLLHILESLFKKTSYTVSFLSGGQKIADRQKVVDDFNSDPEKFVFLISTKAGGVGLNITSANKVVIFDPHWNPSYDLQAQDRAYRIGQLRDVEVYRLVAAGTIEEIVYARQIYKQQQANIGYNASSERRYFKGIQQDPARKGEIFGLHNLFAYHGDHVVLQGIVNQTNVAEARVSMRVVDVNMEQIAADDELQHISVKKEDAGDDDGGLSQLAAFIEAEDPDQLVKKSKKNKAKVDAVQAILQKAGVKYTHENSEVIGSSKVEAQLSRKAELAEALDLDDLHGDSALFADVDSDHGAFEGEDDDPDAVFAPSFKPPDEVKVRQFCSMAKEFGFDSAQEFALCVEQMTQEERREALDEFYKRRMALLVEEQLKKDADADVKNFGAVKTEAGGSKNVKFKADDDAKIKTEWTASARVELDSPVKTETEMKEEFKTKQELVADKLVTAMPKLVNGPGPISSVFIDGGDDDDEF